jgi:hypothetical protein
MNIHETEKFVEDVKVALAEIDGLAISEHADGYDTLHRNLESALSTIEGI